jgi:Flp pilus assembly protein TadG
LVEFAILAPLLVALLLGIVEFAWLFSQNIDVRHGAREAARLAATDYGSAGAIIAETCNRMDIAGTGAVSVTLQRSGGSIGDKVTVTVSAMPSSITGFLGSFIPGSLQSQIETRLEQNPSWSDAGPTACP